MASVVLCALVAGSAQADDQTLQPASKAQVAAVHRDLAADRGDGARPWSYPTNCYNVWRARSRHKYVTYFRSIDAASDGRCDNFPYGSLIYVVSGSRATPVGWVTWTSPRGRECKSLHGKSVPPSVFKDLVCDSVMHL